MRLPLPSPVTRSTPELKYEGSDTGRLSGLPSGCIGRL
jgi:hypothetical protein